MKFYKMHTKQRSLLAYAISYVNNITESDSITQQKEK